MCLHSNFAIEIFTVFIFISFYSFSRLKIGVTYFRTRVRVKFPVKKEFSIFYICTILLLLLLLLLLLSLLLLLFFAGPGEPLILYLI